MLPCTAYRSRPGRRERRNARASGATRERWLTVGQDVRGYAGQVAIVKHKLGRAGAVVPIRITFNGTVRGEGL